ncbi:MAG: rhodanese-like domain-containing protein [Candidatus Dadabacteria bacterium]|nr:MAG: rhodanese-like domain-containing protein [Candidatus Dadabacteria bacterium]
MRKKSALLVVSLVLLWAINAFAKESLTPEHIDGVKVVTPHEAYEMQKNGAHIIDARKKIEYMESHIKGAVLVSYKGKTENKPDFDLDAYDYPLEKYFPDKNAKLIFYCNGVRCWKSYKAVKEALSEGYKNVYWLREGLPAWKKAGLPVE